MGNRRRECEIASKRKKTAGQVLADIAEQTVTPALVTYFKGVKTDACSSLLLFSQCIRKLTLHSLQFADNVGWCTTTSFITPQTYFDYETFYLVQCFSTVFGIFPIFEMHRGMRPGCTFSRFHERFWHFAHFRNAQEACGPVIFFFSFSCATSKKLSQ